MKSSDHLDEEAATRNLDLQPGGFTDRSNHEPEWSLNWL